MIIIWKCFYKEKQVIVTEDKLNKTREELLVGCQHFMKFRHFLTDYFLRDELFLNFEFKFFVESGLLCLSSVIVSKFIFGPNFAKNLEEPNLNNFM